MKRRTHTLARFEQMALQMAATQQRRVRIGLLAGTLGIMGCGADGGGASAGLPLQPDTSAAQGGARQAAAQGGSAAGGAAASGSVAGASTSEVSDTPLGFAGSSSSNGSLPNGSSAGGAGAGADAGADAAAAQGGSDMGVQPPPVFAPCPSPTTACAILPLGDSITDGVGSSGGGYRVELFRQALANQQNITFVGTSANGPNVVNGMAFPRNHEGHSGFTISGGVLGSLAGLVDAAIGATRPNIVLLLIGTNDVDKNVDLARAPARLGVLLDQITGDAPDALVVVGQIIPTTNAQTNTRVQAYNAAIPGLVQSRAEAGKHVVLVDMFTPFISNPNFAGLMVDILHPNDAGYVVLGRAWHDAIDRFLPSAP